MPSKWASMKKTINNDIDNTATQPPGLSNDILKMI